MSTTESISRKSKQCPNYNLAVCVLASGSKGNAICISNGVVTILIDAGLSGVEIERRLQSQGFSAEDLDAILVSHEHSDHIQGVGVLSRRYHLPVYMTTGTREAGLTQMGEISELKIFECGIPFMIENLIVHPFSTSHDAKDPAGFTIHHNGSKVGIATDLGIVTTMVKEHLKDCALMILEANHDPTMLIEGPYPWPIKQRIKSRTGHLSNEDSKSLLEELKHDRLKHVILAHLSETNNTPQKALNEVGQALTDCDVNLSVACQDMCSLLFYL